MRLTAEEVARTHTEVFNAALLSGDLDTLAMLYADDYMLVRPDGSVLSKDEVLYDLREGGLTFKSIEVTERSSSSPWNGGVADCGVVDGDLHTRSGGNCAHSTSSSVCD